MIEPSPGKLDLTRSGRKIPARQSNRVDFPLPEGPVIAEPPFPYLEADPAQRLGASVSLAQSPRLDQHVAHASLSFALVPRSATRAADASSQRRSASRWKTV